MAHQTVHDPHMNDRRRTIVLALLALLAAGYFALLLANTCFFATGPDSSGYLGQARMLAAGRVSIEIEPLRRLQLDPKLAYLFTPYGFKPRGPFEMVPTYAAGTPLHLMLAAKLGGWTHAPFLVQPLAAIGCLLLIFAIARQLGLTFGWSVAAALLLASVPIFVSNALQPVSDVLATFWSLLAMNLAMSAGRRALRPARHSSTFAALAGIAFAIGVLVRPTNLLLALAIAFALQWRPRLLAIAAAAAAPFGAALLWHQHALYGSPWRTGYGTPGELLSWSTFRTCSWFYTKSLATVVTPLVAIGGLLTRRMMLLVWFLPFFLFYSFYGFCDVWSATRFLLPAIPALILAFLLLVQRAPRRIGVAIMLLIIGWNVRNIGSYHVLHANEWEAVFPDSVRMATRHAPKNAMVATAILSGAYYVEAKRFSLRWDQVDAETANTIRAALPPNTPWFALVSAVEGGEAELTRRIPGRWRAIDSVRDVTLYQLEQ
jgi:hypothetical protein